MLLTDADQLREALAFALRERDEAQAEVARLRGVVERLQQHYAELVRISCLSVAERQREACARSFKLSDTALVYYKRREAEEIVRATPLVTEGKT